VSILANALRGYILSKFLNNQTLYIVRHSSSSGVKRKPDMTEESSDWIIRSHISFCLPAAQCITLLQFKLKITRVLSVKDVSERY
jgi:hypothetical protein